MKTSSFGHLGGEPLCKFRVAQLPAAQKKSEDAPDEAAETAEEMFGDEFCKKVGGCWGIMMRPDYFLGGIAMSMCYFFNLLTSDFRNSTIYISNSIQITQINMYVTACVRKLFLYQVNSPTAQWLVPEVFCTVETFSLSHYHPAAKIQYFEGQ